MALLVLISWLFADSATLLVVSVLSLAFAIVASLSRRPFGSTSRSRRLVCTGLSLAAVLVPAFLAAQLLERPELLLPFSYALEWMVAATLAYQTLPRGLYAAWRVQWS